MRTFPGERTNRSENHIKAVRVVTCNLRPYHGAPSLDMRLKVVDLVE